VTPDSPADRRSKRAEAAVVDDAVAAFEAEYGPGPGRPLCVVIAAFDEAASVGAVVAGVPARVAGLEAECIVVDDGSGDGTARAALGAGALVCRLGRNLGQGWALRAGYQLAARRRASVVATLDADGQHEPAELASIVGPVASGAADFAVGSRRLGRSEARAGLRRAGVVVFARVVSALTGTRVTDPSNGFRAFRPEVVQTVRLYQPQYQAAELLIGALSAGFEVVEVPVTIRARTAGASKKGPDLLYGLRFGRVVLSSWRVNRQGRSRPRP
jgi:glycosyltransferase involved in cell wall biosynthesis